MGVHAQVNKLKVLTRAPSLPTLPSSPLYPASPYVSHECSFSHKTLIRQILCCELFSQLTFSPLVPGVPAPPRSPGIPAAPWDPGGPAVPTAPGSPWTENQRIVSILLKIANVTSAIISECFYRYTHLVSIRARSTSWATDTEGSLRTSTPSESGVTTLSLHSDTRE